MSRSLQAHSGARVRCQRLTLDPRTWAMLHPAEMKGDLVYHRPSRFPLAKALLLCYDAWWDGFECQVSNHTPRVHGDSTISFPAAMSWVNAAATGGSSINLKVACSADVW
jgi:hypothetical protein